MSTRARSRALAAVEHGDGPGVSAGHAVKQFAVRSVVPGALDPRAQISVGNCHAVARIVRVRADGEFVDTYRPDPSTSVAVVRNSRHAGSG